MASSRRPSITGLDEVKAELRHVNQRLDRTEVRLDLLGERQHLLNERYEVLGERQNLLTEQAAATNKKLTATHEKVDRVIAGLVHRARQGGKAGLTRRRGRWDRLADPVLSTRAARNRATSARPPPPCLSGRLLQRLIEIPENIVEASRSRPRCGSCPASPRLRSAPRRRAGDGSWSGMDDQGLRVADVREVAHELGRLDERLARVAPSPDSECEDSS